MDKENNQISTWSRVLSEKTIFYDIHPIVVYHIQTDILATVFHQNKFY